MFGSGAYSKPAQVSLECKHYSLTSDAPSGKEGAAFLALMAEKVRLAALLPEGWSRDMTTFLSTQSGGAVIPAQFLHRMQP
ncbi:putative parB-like nuclease [Escherichia coli Envira 10/1]|nr:putative parB-like nuclease [Escherichia coli Envira 10/1]